MNLKEKTASGFLFFLILKSKTLLNFKNNAVFLFYNFNNITIYQQLYKSVIMNNFYFIMKLLPYISAKVANGIESATENLKEDLNKHDQELNEIFNDNNVNLNNTTDIIPKINSEIQLITLLEQLRNHERYEIPNNRVSGTIYTSIGKTKKRTELFLSRIIHLYYLTNPLHPDVFPTLRFIERNLINFTLKLFNADLDNGREY